LLAVLAVLLQVRSPEDTDETLIDMQTAKGVTPLAMAAEKGRLGVVRDLLGRKADPCHRDAGESTPLHLAAQVRICCMMLCMLYVCAV
jgi:ankyrin repeat protein